MKVKLYTKPKCPQCDKTKMALDIMSIEYEALPITPAVMKRHPDKKQAPIVEAGNASWCGYDYEKIRGLRHE